MLLYEIESYAIRGVIFDVYRALGCGFLEAVYQECFEIELNRRNIPFDSQKRLELYYKGDKLNHTYKPDLICYSSIIVEIKALSKTTSDHHAQVLNYLKASRMKLGLLVNFGSYPKATIERLVL